MEQTIQGAVVFSASVPVDVPGCTVVSGIEAGTTTDSGAGEADVDDGVGAVCVDSWVGVCVTMGAAEESGMAVVSGITGVVTGPLLDAGTDVDSIAGRGDGAVCAEF